MYCYFLDFCYFTWNIIVFYSILWFLILGIISLEECIRMDNKCVYGGESTIRIILQSMIMTFYV
jgi:hypothetical protein